MTKHFMTEHNIQCIMWLLNASKNVNFMTDCVRPIHCIISLLKLSKTCDYMLEYILHRMIMRLNQIKLLIL